MPAEPAAIGTSDIERLLAGLCEPPVRIAAATARTDEAALQRRTAEDPWSVSDVLAHVRSVADHRLRSIRRMATGDVVKLRYESPRAELRRTDYLDRPFAENLAAFSADRAALVGWLETLPADAWGRGALIRDRPETVASYVGYLTDHELVHCEQIESLVRQT